MQPVKNFEDVLRNATTRDGMVAAVDDDAGVVGGGEWGVGCGSKITRFGSNDLGGGSGVQRRRVRGVDVLPLPTPHSPLPISRNHGLSPASPSGVRPGVKWYLLSTMKKVRSHRDFVKKCTTTPSNSLTRADGGASGGAGVPS